MEKLEWKKTRDDEFSNYVLDNKRGKVFISYQPNDWLKKFDL